MWVHQIAIPMIYSDNKKESAQREENGKMRPKYHKWNFQLPNCSKKSYKPFSQFSQINAPILNPTLDDAIIYS